MTKMMNSARQIIAMGILKYLAKSDAEVLDVAVAAEAICGLA